MIILPKVLILLLKKSEKVTHHTHTSTSVNPKCDLANIIGSSIVFIDSTDTIFVTIVLLIVFRCRL